MAHESLKTQPSFLSPGMHDRNRLLGTTVSTYIGTDGPQPLGSLTRAVQLELPPPNDIVEESVTRQWIVAAPQLDQVMLS